MNPIDKIKELREFERLNQTEFSKKYKLKDNAIKHIESGLQNIPDDLALALEKEYKIPFKWWKTGQGMSSFDELVNGGVNENYLITGEGEAFIEQEKSNIATPEDIQQAIIDIRELKKEFEEMKNKKQ